MPIFLTLITIATIATIFYTPIPAQFVSTIHIAAIVLPTLLLITQILGLGKKSSSSAKEDQQNEPAAIPQAAAISGSQQEVSDAAVVQFLARLQEKGRLVDFIMDDIARYDDESVGAAARIVHQGCSELLKSCFSIAPVHSGEEMDTITLADNYDSCAYRLSGNIPSAAPFIGQVLHRGWKTTSINLPQIVNSADNLAHLRSIIAPAEIEID